MHLFRAQATFLDKNQLPTSWEWCFLSLSMQSGQEVAHPVLFTIPRTSEEWYKSGNRVHTIPLSITCTVNSWYIKNGLYISWNATSRVHNVGQRRLVGKFMWELVEWILSSFYEWWLLTHIVCLIPTLWMLYIVSSIMHGNTVWLTLCTRKWFVHYCLLTRKLL